MFHALLCESCTLNFVDCSGPLLTTSMINGIAVAAALSLRGKPTDQMVHEDINFLAKFLSS